MKKGITSEEAMNEMQKIFRKRGRRALEMARKEILREKFECKEVREALYYFMNKYWHDLARPSLMSLVCEAVGGNREATMPLAIPMTLISGAMDIHDDIIDQSEMKSGKPTVYGKYGRDTALLAGDALLFKGLMLLNKTAVQDIPTEKLRDITGTVEKTFLELGDAEALELQFRGNLDVSPDEYLRVVRKKAADVEAHTRIGAILGGASPRTIEALGEYGRLLGMLIILRDDWIDIFELEEIRSRIMNESLPLPLLYGLQHPTIKDKLGKILLKGAVTVKDYNIISKAIQETDALEKHMNLMSEMAEQALLRLRKQKVKQEKLELIIKATISFNEAESS